MNDNQKNPDHLDHAQNRSNQISLAKDGLPDWAQRPLVRQIFDGARALGGEARIVGGAVRDWLAGYPVGDIDMAINLPIETVASHMRAHQMRVVETGLKHGTITLFDGDDQIELTQTRVDLETDGRHAIVAHDRDWTSDAARRDFTINAIYLDADGAIFDPLGGQADLQAGRLRFAGDAGQRAQEDALRMMRYCRFLPRFGIAGIDPDARDALRQNAHLCAALSGERVGYELRRILRGNSFALGIAMMNDTAIDQAALGVPLDAAGLAFDAAAEVAIAELDRAVGHGWLGGLAAVMPAGSAAALSDRLRLSRAETRWLARLDQGLDDENMTMLAGARWRQAAYYLGDMAAMLYAVQSWRNKTPVSGARLAEIGRWQAPENPLCGADLLSHGVDNGPGLGQMLKDAEARWVRSNFTLAKPALLEWLFGN
ncbi:CCA tRNA nucleotidyltransferase [Alphaproteobacteria bacterium LSUCC0744]